MRKFFLEGFYFCLPPIIFCLFIFCIDPYNYFNVSKVISDDTKFMAANRSNDVMPRGDMLWKVLQYSRNPCRNVIIGNSQGFSIREKLISELTGEPYYNFSIPGASLSTTVSTFWYIVKKSRPEKVFLQVSFALSNSSEKRTYNLFHFAQDYLDKPYLYFMNKDILIDSYYNLKYELSKKKDAALHIATLKAIDGKDSLSEIELKSVFDDYIYPDKDMLELKKIAAYCKANNIQLECIILPTYRRVNDYLLEKGLIEMRERFRYDISTLGKTYDYMTVTDISNYETNFIDYFHQKQSITDSLTSMIWKGKNESDTLNLK